MTAYDTIAAAWGYLAKGGWVMIPLAVMSATLWYGLGYRLLTLRRGNLRSVRVLIDRYAGGYPKPPTGLIDRAVVIGLRESRVGPARPGELRRRLREAFAPLRAEMGRFAQLCRAIVAVAPLCGLLGTVSGMIETFDALADMALFSQSGGVAGGISQALFSTQLGLSVAVPGMVIGRALGRRQEIFEMELDRITDHLCANARDQEAGP